MKNTARAMLLRAPRTLEAIELDLPEIGSDDALLRVEACGLCGTDHEQYTGDIKREYAYIPGHEAVGTIERIGPAAAESWGVAEGDVVAVEPLQSCRECAACLSGRYSRCVKYGYADFYGIKNVQSSPSGLLGGYATYMYLSADYRVIRVPSSLSAVEATLFNPVGAGFRWGVTVPETGPGSVCAVLGPGIRGLSACAAMKEAGAEFVMLTGRGEADRARLDLGKDFGADLVVDVREENPALAMKRELGRLADIVLDATAKAPSAFAQSISIARPGGTICIAAIRASSDAPGFQPDHIVYKELRILGVAGVDTPAYEQAFELLASRKYPFESLPRRVVGLEDAGDLLAQMSGERSGDRPVHGVVAPWLT